LLGNALQDRVTYFIEFVHVFSECSGISLNFILFIQLFHINAMTPMTVTGPKNFLGAG
jgi:hypothetical protein